nr:9443_t:CDS:2 [Entrophospora candida]
MSPLLTDLLEEYDTAQLGKDANPCRIRKKFGNEFTKLDVGVELRNYGVELVTAEVGITKTDNDGLKFCEDRTALK